MYYIHYTRTSNNRIFIAEAESFKCWKKRHKKFQSPSENFMDYQMEQLSREYGREVEKEPSDEECENERLGYNKRRSLAEQFYMGFLCIIVPVVVYFMINTVKIYIASLSKNENEGARLTRTRSNKQQMAECLRLKKLVNDQFRNNSIIVIRK